VAVPERPVVLRADDPIGRRDGVGGRPDVGPAGTDCLLTLQTGHYSKVPFSLTCGSPCTSPLHPVQLDFFGDLKSSKTAASKSLKEKRQAKKRKPAVGALPRWEPRSPSSPRSGPTRGGLPLRLSSIPDDAGGPTLGCDQGLMSVRPPDPVAHAHITLDNFQNLALARWGADLG
jgi:hypothetical protein